MGDSGRPSDPLGLEAEAMRRLGHWVVDQVVDHFERGPDGPAIRTGGAEDLWSALGGAVPEEPGDPLAAMSTLVDVALANMQHVDHPRYFARVPNAASFAGVLGEWLGVGFNALATSWAGGSGPATVELVVLEWLRGLLGLDVGTEGVLTSGGSLANLMGLAVARRSVGVGVAYLSDQTHASIGRGLGALGFAPGQIRVLESDARFRLSVDAVAAAVSADRSAGLRPGFVVATAGTTNSGAVDPLPGLAGLCAREGLWLHVDGAYGAPAALCQPGRSVLPGLELADSLVLDPHKWLFQPYDVGCLFVRRPGELERTFAMTPEYLADTRAGHGEVDFRNRTLELTRRARALKLWLTFRTYGAHGIRAAIARCLELAEHAERLLRADSRWEVVTPAQLAIVTFARRGAAAGEHAARVAALARDGYAAVTSTTLRDRSVLRLCTINPRSTEEDIASTLELLLADLHTRG
ncbi:MAG: aminotransferase class I/II-fold pyridoxal phosphate-dependent enzyme [Solirubrobacterales bacterium]|nr:aminotransferase class I/II-fold pyridoxal phosphate-dependent enzyme [Solirubrobacterales bacterium]MBV9717571.1 aminotransferase class I/II-fold pyridoxal phosphate-dependent enzyme [Solirubrobacterales bacterium]